MHLERGEDANWSAVRDFKEFVERDLRPTLRTAPMPQGAKSIPIVLLEATTLASHQLAHTYLATALAAEHEARIIAYRAHKPETLWQQVKRGVKDACQALRTGSPFDSTREIYAAFCNEVIELRPSRRLQAEARTRTRAFFSQSPDLFRLEEYSVEGAVVGDLILDKHVQRGNPRIRLDDPGLVQLIEEVTARALALVHLFSQYPVVAVISSGPAVLPGLPIRLAVSHGIAAFPTTFDFSWRLTREQPYWGRDYVRYREKFSSLTSQQQEDALEEAENFLTRSLTPGESSKSGLGSTTPWSRRQQDMELLPIKRAGQRTVLVAAHSFFDTPHNTGRALFPDFFSWFEHIAQLARRTDYEWLFKLHPDERDKFIGVATEVSALLGDIPNAHLIPPETSHWALLQRGVDVALTVFGSIAVEYPALGVPVIVSWPDGFTSAYSFTLQPTSIAEYDEAILDPSMWKYDISRTEILEYVYCHYLSSRGNGVFRRVPAIVQHGRDHGAFKNLSFHSFWAANVTGEESKAVLQLHREWLRSGSYSRNAFDPGVNGLG